MSRTTVLPVLVDESIKGHPVPPTSGEIVYVDIGVPAEETHLKVRMMSPAGSGWRHHPQAQSHPAVFI